MGSTLVVLAIIKALVLLGFFLAVRPSEVSRSAD